MSARACVIVPAHDAAATLPRLLDALEPLRGREDVEVLLVDDASTDATAALAEERGFRVLRLERNQGPAAARNAGMAATRAPLIAFTDADCAPAPGWLDALVAALADHDLVQGPVLPERPPGPFDRTVALTAPSPRFETANLAVRRAFATPFARLPEVNSGHFGEDVLFGWSAVRAGARRGWAPDAVVRHAVFARGPRGHLAEQPRLELFPPLVREVPELRATMPLRLFLTRRTLRFDVALLAAAAAAVTRRPILLAGVLPYARARAHMPRRLWRRSVLRVNLALVVGDAVGFAALVRGSLRARTVVL